MVRDTRRRGWVWVFLFGAVGISSLVDYTRVAEAGLSSLLYGVGFLLLVPQAFVRPVSFTKPLWPQFKEPAGATQWVDLIALAGIILVVAGLIARWL